MSLPAKVTALVLPHLDNWNSVLYGLPTSLIRRLQSVQNATARLIFRLRRSEHITPALINLHWLRIPERISYASAVYAAVVVCLSVYRSVRHKPALYQNS